MSRIENEKRIFDASQKFPSEFGLRAFPGKRFRISRAASFVNGEGKVILFTSVFDSNTNKWEAFAKGTVEELQRQIAQ